MPVQISMTQALGKKASSITKKFFWYGLMVVIGFIVTAIIYVITDLGELVWFPWSHRGRLENRTPYFMLILPFALIAARWVYLKYQAKDKLVKKLEKQLRERTMVGVNYHQEGEDHRGSMVPSFEINDQPPIDSRPLPNDQAEAYRRKVIEQEKDRKIAELEQIVGILAKDRLIKGQGQQIGYQQISNEESVIINFLNKK